MTLLLYFLQFSILLSIIFPNSDSFFPKIEGYQATGELETYNPDNLYDIINGAADSYLKYDFEELKVMRYSGDAEQFLQIEIYRHSNCANAFGIYSNERPTETEWLEVGTEGYYESKILNFYKGKYYIKIMGFKIDNIEEFLKDISNKVADKLDGKEQLPKLLESFPEEGKVDHSERYINKNFLGYEPLTEVFTADYGVGGKTFQMFVTEKSDDESCKKMLEDYFTSIKMDKNKIKEGIIHVTDPYQGEIYFLWKNNIVAGVMNCSDLELSKKYLNYVSENLNIK